jgi:NADH:ubiquinone oxidoreductase subunit E
MDTDRAAIAERVAALLSTVPKERSQLLPALWRVFEEYWRIGPEMLEAVSDTMNIPYAEVYGVASFYALFSNAEGKRPVYVCTDVMCALKGSEKLLQEGEEAAHGASVTVKESPCLGHCDAAPALFDGSRTVRNADRSALLAAIRGEQRG